MKKPKTNEEIAKACASYGAMFVFGPVVTPDSLQLLQEWVEFCRRNAGVSFTDCVAPFQELHREKVGRTFGFGWYIDEQTGHMMAQEPKN